MGGKLRTIFSCFQDDGGNLEDSHLGVSLDILTSWHKKPMNSTGGFPKFDFWRSCGRSMSIPYRWRCPPNPWWLGDFKACDSVQEVAWIFFGWISPIFLMSSMSIFHRFWRFLFGVWISVEVFGALMRLKPGTPRFLWCGSCLQLLAPCPWGVLEILFMISWSYRSFFFLWLVVWLESWSSKSS